VSNYWTIDRKSRSTERRHRIEIFENDTANDGGFVKGVKVSRGTHWASVYPLSASQLVKYRAVFVKATHIISVDARVTVTEQDEIVFKGRRFNVLTVENADERGVDKVIIAEEIRPGQHGEGV
jgi:head-tail adaptor